MDCGNQLFTSNRKQVLGQQQTTGNQASTPTNGAGTARPPWPWSKKAILKPPKRFSNILVTPFSIRLLKSNTPWAFLRTSALAWQDGANHTSSGCVTSVDGLPLEKCSGQNSQHAVLERDKQKNMTTKFIYTGVSSNFSLLVSSGTLSLTLRREERKPSQSSYRSSPTETIYIACGSKIIA